MRDHLVEEVVAQRKGSIKIGPFGSALPRAAMVRDGVKVYGQENLISRDWSIGDRRITTETFEMLRSCELNPDDVVIGMMGSLGHCEVFPSGAEPGLMDSHLLRIQTDRRLLTPDYLRILLLSEETVRQIDRLSHGSIMAGLSSKVVRALRILVPSLEEQQQIVEVLDTIDETIEITKHKVDKLKALRRGILQNRLSALLDYRLITIDDLDIEVSVGIVVRPTQYYTSEGIPLLRSANVREGELEMANLVHMSPESHKLMAKTAVAPGDLLTVRTGYPGTTAVVPRTVPEANCVDVVITRTGSAIDPEFLCL